MASVSLAFIPYQPPLATARPAKGRLAPSNRSASKVSYRHNDTVTVASNVGSSAGLKDYELIEYVDLTDSLPIETMDIFSEPILAVGGTEGCVQDPPSTGPSLATGNGECDTPLPSVVEPLRKIEDTQELQYAAATLDHSTPLSPVPDSEAIYPALPENTPVSIFGSPSPPPPPSPPPCPPSSPPLTVLSSISEHQTVGSSDAALKEMEPQHSEQQGDGDKGDGNRANGEQKDKEKGDGSSQNQRAGQEAEKATSATGTRDSSKRTAHSAGFDEDSDGKQSSERAKGGTESAGQLSKKPKQLTPPTSRPRPVFRNPKQIGRQYRRDSTSPSSSDEVGSSQGNPVMLEDKSPVADNSGALIRKTPGCVDAPTDPNPPTDPPDGPSSPDVRPQQHSGRVDHEDDHGADPVAGPPSAATPPPPQQGEARTPALALDEWEVEKIVDKRRVGKGYEYKVRWKETWLPKRELGNARRLLQEFEAQGQAQQRAKKRRTYID